MKFTDKVAIVTGAASGIGEGYARRLAAEGARVIVVDIDETNGRRVADSLNAEGKEAIFQPCDVSSVSDAAALAAVAAERFGGVDFLVNNAAIFGKIEYVPLMEVDLSYFEKVQRVNMTACW